MDYIDFEVLEERWGHYRLPNGIQVKARPSVAYIYREEDAEDVSVDFQTGVSVSAPHAHQGDPASNPDEVEVQEEHAEFEKLRLPRSFYVVDDQDLLVVKAHPDKLIRYNQFHENSQPMIEVRHTLQVNTLEGVAAPLEDPGDPDD